MQYTLMHKKIPAAELEMDQVTGVIVKVREVYRPEHLPLGGPADKAGLLKYDVITAIDGVRTRGFAEMSRELEKHQAGDTITVTVYRCADPETGMFLDNPEYLELELTLEVLD